MTDRKHDVPGVAAKRTLRDRFPALKLLKRSAGRRRLPVVQQTTAADCGAACLTTVLRYHGKHVGLEVVRVATLTGRDGTTASHMVDAARQFGLRGRGVSIAMEDLEYLETGTILHWGFNHFVVFEKRGRQHITVIDPSFGRRNIPFEEAEQQFTGVALLFTPTESFESGGSGTKRVWYYVRKILGHSNVMARVMVASVLIQLFGLGLPVLMGSLVDRVIPRSDSQLLTVLAVALGFMVVFQFLVSMIRSLLLLQLRTQLDVQMTLNFLDHMMKLPYHFFQQRSAGDLMMRMNSNSTVRDILTSAALSGALDGILVMTYLALLFYLSPIMGVVVLGLGFLRVLVFLVSRQRIRDLTSESLAKQAVSQGFQVQMLSGVETLKASGTETRAVDRWTNYYIDVLNVSIARGRLGALLGATSGALGFASPVVILIVGGGLVMGGHLSMGTMLALSALAAGFLGPLSALVQTAMRMQELGSYIERIDDILETAPEQTSDDAVVVDHLEGRVALEGVTFSYLPGTAVLKNISLEIEPGQMVAFVGRTGAGKSTLAKMLMALYLPDTGRIVYDGRDLRSLDLRSVRRNLGIVMQHQYLFGVSIRENIALSDPTITLDEVERAARLAHIHEDILAMPMGYETVLSDGGLSLSGGQRQRLTLARALVKNPSVLILDEATSSLDTLTEGLIQKSLEDLACTRIVIAHRLSTVQSADLIVVMEQGRIVETGTHGELIARGGAYSELQSGQLGQQAQAG